MLRKNGKISGHFSNYITFVQTAVWVAVAVPPAGTSGGLGTRDSAGGIAVVAGGAPLATAALAALSTSDAVASL